MVIAALAVEFLFRALDWIPTERHAEVGKAAFHWNHTTWLNIVALALAGSLYLRYRKSGGPEMMREMSEN